VFRYTGPGVVRPPQTIIAVLAPTAVCSPRAAGAKLAGSGRQRSVAGVYAAPSPSALPAAKPPQTIISPFNQTAVCPVRARGALMLETARQRSVAGSYAAPVPSAALVASCPPQTTISLPVQAAAWPARGLGAPTSDVGLPPGVGPGTMIVTA